MTDATFDADLGALRAQTARLLDTASSLDDEALRGPSLCTGWTRAHVLAHVTRNARAMRNLVATVQGTPTPMYPSRQARDADIEQGARQSRDELLAELRTSAEELDQVLAGLDDAARAATAQVGSGHTLTGAQLPWHRLREVAWHHVDLDAGYSFADAPAELVGRWFEEEVAALRADADTPSMCLRTDERDVVSFGDGRPTVSASRAGMLRWLLRDRADQIDAPAQDRLPRLRPTTPNPTHEEDPQ
ncbi:maleylpyruvate isomerase family mycothiol-dependent enzyme [Arsenicicoccus dermatophilus]|uniref:maleylpyruvate isomerase family mycothiol-dependent enzyme n=1 Tax=Arsenicicoccus dermatophilus TaxID=1076331 RepID=UPI001F4C9928|nr:maleylpyruvate isomerase family mycothiol-dependent enzyme [Arsenicicoccus dermatophilus]MCH8613077.1 maleylpyruvate isomerase family mycothiol-dependent enzyme [Arsenicicoccus dermatophilus]